MLKNQNIYLVFNQVPTIISMRSIQKFLGVTITFQLGLKKSLEITDIYLIIVIMAAIINISGIKIVGAINAVRAMNYITLDISKITKNFKSADQSEFIYFN